MDWLIDMAGHYSALTLLGINEAGRHPLVGAFANLTTLFCGFILVLQLTRLMKGDSRVIQRVDERTAAIEKRYAAELAGKDETIAALLHDALAAVRGYLARALTLFRPLAAAGRLDAQRAGWVDWIEGELGKLALD